MSGSYLRPPQQQTSLFIYLKKSANLLVCKTK